MKQAEIKAGLVAFKRDLIEALESMGHDAYFNPGSLDLVFKDRTCVHIELRAPLFDRGRWCLRIGDYRNPFNRSVGDVARFDMSEIADHVIARADVARHKERERCAEAALAKTVDALNAGLTIPGRFGAGTNGTGVLLFCAGIPATESQITELLACGRRIGLIK
jgi:hypothetical protein